MISRQSLCQSPKLARQRKQSFFVCGNHYLVIPICMDEDLRPFYPVNLHVLTSNQQAPHCRTRDTGEITPRIHRFTKVRAGILVYIYVWLQVFFVWGYNPDHQYTSQIPVYKSLKPPRDQIRLSGIQPDLDPNHLQISFSAPPDRIAQHRAALVRIPFIILLLYVEGCKLFRCAFSACRR